MSYYVLRTYLRVQQGLRPSRFFIREVELGFPIFLNLLPSQTLQRHLSTASHVTDLCKCEIWPRFGLVSTAIRIPLMKHIACIRLCCSRCTGRSPYVDSFQF